MDPDAVGMVGRVGPGIGVLSFGSDRRRERGRKSLGLSIVTNGKFDGSLCGSAWSDGVVAWGGEYRVGPGIGILGGVDVPQAEGVVSGVSSRDLDSKTADYRLHRRLRLKSIRVLEKNGESALK